MGFSTSGGTDTGNPQEAGAADITSGGPTREWSTHDPRVWPAAESAVWHITASGSSGSYDVELGGQGAITIDITDLEADIQAAVDLNQDPDTFTVSGDADDWILTRISAGFYATDYATVDDTNLVGGSATIEQTNTGRNAGLVRPFGSRVAWGDGDYNARIEFEQVNDAAYGKDWIYVGSEERDTGVARSAVWHIAATADSGSYDVTANAITAVVTVGDNEATIQASIDAAFGANTFAVVGGWGDLTLTSEDPANVYVAPGTVTVDGTNLVGVGAEVTIEQTNTGRDAYNRYVSEIVNVETMPSLVQGTGTPTQMEGTAVAIINSSLGYGTFTANYSVTVGATPGDAGQLIGFVPPQPIPGGLVFYPTVGIVGSWFGVLDSTATTNGLVVSGEGCVLATAAGVPITDALTADDTLVITVNCAIAAL